MKVNCNKRGRLIFPIVSVLLLLLLTISVSVGVTYGKYCETVELNLDSDNIDRWGYLQNLYTLEHDSGQDGPEIFDETPTTVYQVQQGDTLQLIAEKFHVAVESLMAYNGIGDPEAIFVGMILHIPPADSSASETDLTKTK